jgi:hypothetical protein
MRHRSRHLRGLLLLEAHRRGGAHTLLEVGGALRSAPRPLTQALELAGLREDEQRQNCDAHQCGERRDRSDLGERAR